LFTANIHTNMYAAIKSLDTGIMCVCVYIYIYTSTRAGRFLTMMMFVMHNIRVKQLWWNQETIPSYWNKKIMET